MSPRIDGPSSSNGYPSNGALGGAGGGMASLGAALPEMRAFTPFQIDAALPPPPPPPPLQGHAQQQFAPRYAARWDDEGAKNAPPASVPPPLPPKIPLQARA